ncbi:DUF4124 domain-containing protein [Aquabacterium sp.]|uniref:DUF4124 domain-containing protein n=1 Tax=Aquabacterium sp. TaxID=1872578 RepID=UPI003B6C9725
MKYVRFASPLLLGLLAVGALVSTPSMAGSQWKWRDANGAIQYSDRPPPVGTPEQAILARPTPISAKPVVTAASAASAAPASTAASKPGSELDAKKRKSDEEKALQQKAEEEKLAKAKAENCERARSYQRTLNDGIRIVRSNAKGEREFLDDKARAEEARKTQESINANCR